jgi:hypothetical protein
MRKLRKASGKTIVVFFISVSVSDPLAPNQGHRLMFRGISRQLSVGNLTGLLQRRTKPFPSLNLARLAAYTLF